MDARNLTIIDLNEFGMPGQIVMGEPTFRAMRDMKNAVASRIKVVDGKVQDNSVENAVDTEIIVIMAYVREAPFHQDLNSFLDFCDKMDAHELGSANRLYSKMQAIVTKLREGEGSPLAN